MVYTFSLVFLHGFPIHQSFSLDKTMVYTFGLCFDTIFVYTKARAEGARLGVYEKLAKTQAKSIHHSFFEGKALVYRKTV